MTLNFVTSYLPAAQDDAEILSHSVNSELTRHSKLVDREMAGQQHHLVLESDAINLGLYNRIVFERRVLFGATIFTLLAIVEWVVSISTDYWYVINSTDGSYIEETNGTGYIFLRSHAGLFKICTTDYYNQTNPQKIVSKYFSNFYIKFHHTINFCMHFSP